MAYGINYDKYFRSKMNRLENEMFRRKDAYDSENLDWRYDWTLTELLDKSWNENWLEIDKEIYDFEKPEPPIGALSKADLYIQLTKDFYYMFVQMFYAEHINQQTMDLHKLNIRSIMLKHKEKIKSIVLNIYTKELTNTGESVNTKTSQDNGGEIFREAFSDVPEDKVDVDVSTTNMEYATTFVKNKRSKDGTSKSTDKTNNTETKARDPKDMVLETNLFDEVLIDIENLFMKIY